MAESAPENPPGRRLRIPLAVALTGGMVLLLLLGIGSALWTTLSGARTNTFALLGNRATMTLDLLESRIDGELLPVVDAGSDLARQFADGRLDLAERRERTLDTFGGVLAAVPQATGVIVVTPERGAMRVWRPEGIVQEIPATPVVEARQKYALETAARSREPFWGPPLWIPTVGQPVLTFLSPIWRGDEYRGVVVVSVTLAEVSRFLERLERTGDLSAFILYGGDRILAHPRLEEAGFEATEALVGNPLPSIDTLPDPAFDLLRGGGEAAAPLLDYAPGLRDARIDDRLIVITRDTARYGDEPWTLGVRIPRAAVSQEIDRLRESALAGLAILAVAIAGGILFARLLNRQIGRLVRAATALTRLDTSSAPRIPDSRIRELSVAAAAFNALTNTLHWFETYVPKQLVLRLMRGADSEIRPEERELTIMFTDIRGFSTLAEHMSAEDTASLLNAHFAMLAEAIEAEGGTVDKFIGDAIMAFWGAPERMDDHADRALRAAAEIQRRVQADNERRRAAGEPPLAVRLGLHAGPVIVGNIGSRSRVNYTIVGDTVNTAARIDSLAKEMAGAEDCIVLVSGDVRARAGADERAGYALQSLGEREIRGRDARVRIFSLQARTDR